MKRENRAYMKMIYALIAFFVKYAEKIKDNLKVQNSLSLINGYVKKIEYWREIQKRDARGITRSKANSKKRLAKEIFILSSLIRSYAFDIKNDVLYDSVRLPQSHIARLGDTVILRYADTVIILAGENEEALIEYGFTKDMLDKIEEELKKFRDWMSKPKEIRSLKATATVEIKANLLELRKLVVGSLDNAMALYIANDNVFFEEYEKVRSIDDPITRHLSLYGHVLDEETKLALRNVAVTIIRSKAVAELASTVKLTTESGFYGFKGLEPGKYKVIFSLDGYDTLEMDIVLYPLQSRKLDVKLRKTE